MLQCICLKVDIYIIMYFISGRLHNQRTFSASGDFHLHHSIEIEPPSDPMKETHVTSSTLHLKLGRLNTESRLIQHRSHIRVDAYQLLAPVEGPLETKKIDSMEVILSENIVEVEFDISAAVQDWITYPHENFGILIKSQHFNLTSIFRPVLTKHDESHYNVEASRLVVYTAEREILYEEETEQVTGHPDDLDCTRGDGNFKCCRYPVWISFQDLGWDSWVLQPKGYQAYYCDGSCPKNYKTMNNFAHIKSFLHMLQPNDSPSKCCTATDMSPLSILHYENGRLIVSVLEDMVVNSCGCA